MSAEQAPRALSRILAVEDQKIMHLMFDRAFEGSEFVVDHAYDGPEALAKLRNGNYCALPLDLHLPEMNGIDLLKTLRQSHPALGVIIITADRDEALMEEARGLGVREFIIKPVTERDRLLGAVRRLAGEV